ncbi:MAG: hypothetical protein ACHQ1D_11020, partial [Nitrososphaerales archaeon]
MASSSISSSTFPTDVLEQQTLRKNIRKEGVQSLRNELKVSQNELSELDIQKLTKNQLVDFVYAIRSLAGQSTSVNFVVPQFDSQKVTSDFTSPDIESRVHQTTPTQVMKSLAGILSGTPLASMPLSQSVREVHKVKDSVTDTVTGNVVTGIVPNVSVSSIVSSVVPSVTVSSTGPSIVSSGPLPSNVSQDSNAMLLSMMTFFQTQAREEAKLREEKEEREAKLREQKEERETKIRMEEAKLREQREEREAKLRLEEREREKERLLQESLERDKIRLQKKEARALKEEKERVERERVALEMKEALALKEEKEKVERERLALEKKEEQAMKAEINRLE